MQAMTTKDKAEQPDKTEAGQYLTFMTADECYAIGILDVQEIIEVGRMTRVPLTPAHIRGVINLRGSVVPVVDLNARLGKSISGLSKRSCIVLVEVSYGEERQSLGMLVDEVKEILEIAPGDLQPAPAFGTDVRTDFIQAMGRVDDTFMILLDVNHVLSVSELAEMEAQRQVTEAQLHGVNQAFNLPSSE
jgi:purine-binding chemotaxis protein CheW